MNGKKREPDPSKAFTARDIHRWMWDHATLEQLGKFRRWINEIMQIDCKCEEGKSKKEKRNG